MHWILERLWRMSDDFRRDLPTWGPAVIMFNCAYLGNGILWNDPDTPEIPHRHLIEAELQQRAWLLSAVNILTILPCMVFWLVGILSYTRSPRSRLWSLGGALATFLVLMGLHSALMWWSPTRGSHTGSWKEWAIWSHLGLGAGCRLSKTSLARRLVPPRSNEEEPFPSAELSPFLELGNITAAEDEESRLPEEAKPEAKASDKRSWLKRHLSTAWHAALMIWIVCVVVSRAATRDLPLLSSKQRSHSGFNKLDFVLVTAYSIFMLGWYAILAYDYPKRTTHLPREVAVGMLFAISSFATLRMTSAIDTWQSWTIDGLLAFLGFNLGLFAGYRSRLGTSL